MKKIENVKRQEGLNTHTHVLPRREATDVVSLKGGVNL